MMHEWALADGVIATALRTAETERLTHIHRIEVVIGELQQIETEIFSFALKEVLPSADSRLAGTDIELQTEPAVFRCRVCGRETPFAVLTKGLTEDEAEAIHFIPELAHSYLKCPQCGSPDFEVVKGRGVWIGAVVGE